MARDYLKIAALMGETESKAKEKTAVKAVRQYANSTEDFALPGHTGIMSSVVRDDTQKKINDYDKTTPSYELKYKNGNAVGKISEGAYNAFGNFSIDDYVPNSVKELETIRKFDKTQPMFNISIDGKPYEVSYNAGEAVTKGNFDYNATNKADEEAMKAFRSAPLYEYTIGDKTFKLSHNAKKSIENRDFSYTPLNSDEQSVVDAVRAEQFTVYNDYMLSTNPTDPAKREALVNKKSALDAEYDSVYVAPQAATRSGDPKLKERYNRMKELGDERKNINGQIEQYDISVDEYNWRKSAIDEYNALDDDKRRLVTQYINAYTAEKEYDTNLAHLVHKDAKDIMIEKAPKENMAKAKREEYEKQLDGVISKGLKQYIQQYVNFMDTEEQREFLKESNKDPFVATANTVLSVPASLVSPIGLVETVSAKVQNRPIDPNSGWYGASNYSENVRSDIKNKISEGNGVLGQIGAGAYDLGTNLADFFAATAVGGGIGKAIGGAAGLSAAATSRVTSVATQALMASRSASDTIKQAKRDGASDSQAMVLGLVSGMAEAFFEKFSIENWKFFKTNPVAKKNVWTFLKSTAKGFLPEGTEELSTELTNFVFDNVIMGENSTYNRRVKEIMTSENVSEDKARAKASLEVLGQSGYAFLLGGLSGSFMSGIGHIVAPTIKERANYLNKYANSIKLVDSTFKFNPLDPEKATAEDIERVEKLFEPYEKKVQQYNKEVEKARRNEADSKIYELSDKYNAYRGEAASELEAYKNSGKTDEEVKAFEAAQKDRANDYKTLIGKYRRYKDGTALADEFIANASASLDTATHIDITDNSPVVIMSDGRGKYTVIDSDGYIFIKNTQQIAQRYTPVEGTDANAMAETAQAPDTAPTATESANVPGNASINATNTEDEIPGATSEEDGDIAIENAKRESGFGDEGAKLLADLNKNGTMSRTEVKATKAAYIAGYTNDSDFEAKTDAQKQAFEAGKKDRTTRDAADIEKAKNATVYEGSVVANESYKKLSKQERKMAERIAKDAGLSVEFVGVLFADAKKTVEANAQHTDGKLERSDTSENEVHVDLIHEVLHRMKQIAPKEAGVLIDALYRNAENISGKTAARGALYDLKYDEIKAQHDAAGLTSMEIGDYIEEVATREMQRFFSDAAAFNKWRDKLDADAELKSAWQRFGEFMRKLIDDLKRAFSQIGMSAEERASANKALAELEEIEKLYANAYKATQKAVESAAKKESTSEQVPKNSQNDGRNKSADDYNVTTNNSIKKLWHTGFSERVVNELEKRVERDVISSTKAITDTANWYTTFINGKEYFVIYSTEDPKPTILYASKDKRAEFERDYLQNWIEVREYAQSNDGKPDLISRVSNSNWMPREHSIQNNVQRMGGGSNDRNAGVLQGQSRRKPSRAFRDVIENLFEISDRGRGGRVKQDNSKFSLKDSNGKTEAEALENVGIQYDGIKLLSESEMPSITPKHIEELRSIGRKTINEFTSADIEKAAVFAQKMWRALGIKSPFFRAWFGDWRSADKKSKIEIANIPEYVGTNKERKKNRGIVLNKDTEWKINISREGETNTISHSGENRMSELGLAGIRELIEKAVLLDCEVHEHHKNNAKTDLISFDHKLYALGESTDGSIALYKITVEEYFQSKSEPENKRFHNLRYIEKVADVGGRTSEESRSGGSTNDISATVYSVSDLFDFVKTHDKDFKPKEPSKVVNTDGAPMIVYHGTNKTFEIFESLNGVYWFSESYDYAESMAEERSGNTIMPCYLSLKNPFYVKLPEGKFSDPTYENPIITEAKSNHYDGVVFETDTDNELVYDKFYVVFEKTQIKSATDNVGTYNKGNQNINFSLKTNSGKPSKETQKLLDTINKLKNELKLTEFAKADLKELTKMVKGLIKDYYSTLEVKDIYDAVDKLYQYMANGEDGHPAVWENVYDMAYEIAHEIVMSSEVTDDSTYNDYASLRSYLRTTPIKFDTEHDEVPHGYESFNSFRKKNFGRFNFTKNGMSIDSFYQELSELYPEFFDAEEQMDTASMLSRIEEVLDEIQPVEVNPFSYEVESASAHLANDIINRFLDMPQAKPTFADKQKRKLVQTKIAARKKLDNLRERKDIQIKKEKQKREAAIAKMSEAQKAKVLRARILRHVDKLKNKLLKPTDKQHIPQILQRTVAKMLESINLESSYEYVYGTDGKYHRVDRGEYRGAEPSKRTTAFIKLKDAYAEIAKGPTKENPDIEAVSVDPDLMGDFGLLETVIKMGDKRISDMSSEELDIIWQTIKAVEASISSVNKMFSASRYATVEALANAIREDNDSKKGRTEFVKPFRNIQRFVQLEMLNPETFFHWMGNSGDTIFRMMRNAQDYQTTIMKEVSDFTKKTVKDTKIAKLEKTIHTVTLGGKEVKLSTAQLMELYVLMNREQAKRHILGGGISPEEVGGKPVDGKKTFKERVFVTPRKTIMGITPEEIEAAINNLSEEQKAIADKLQKYASTVLSDYGNKASMQVYNYEKFNEDVYWPIRVDRLNLKDKEGSGFDVPSVAAKGFTRATDPNATSSIYIGSIFDTFAAHAAEMATYSAWLGTMEDINRVRNFSFRNEDGKPVSNVKAIINNVHGEGGAGYLQKLMTDIAIGSNIKDLQSPFDSFTGAYKAASVGANLRVIIQQPTSILRATEMINPVYILKVMIRPLSGWEKAKKYAPIAQWKDWGHFDLNTGRRMKDVLFDSASNLEKLKQLGMKGASTADSLAWGTLWNAVEEEIKSKHPELGEANEEFYNAVASRFTEIIDHTQVVDGVLQRNGVMRQKDGLFKMASSFMSEPTKQYNMALYAAYDALISKGSKRMKAVGALGKTAIALVISVITNAAAQSVIDALRDDDREKDYFEKWISYFGENSLDAANPLNYIPFGKDIVSIAQGYDVNRMDTETIARTFKATTDLWKAINGKGKISKIEAITNLIGEAGRIFGLPISNITRDVKSIATTIVNSTDNYYLQYIMDKSMLNLGFKGNSQTFMPILYEAYKNDKEAHELIYNDLIKSGFYDADRIKGNMEDRMKDEAGVKSVKDLPKRYEAP